MYISSATNSLENSTILIPKQGYMLLLRILHLREGILKNSNGMFDDLSSLNLVNVFNLTNIRSIQFIVKVLKRINSSDVCQSNLLGVSICQSINYGKSFSSVSGPNVLQFYLVLDDIPYVTGIFRKYRSSFLLNHRYLEETQKFSPIITKLSNDYNTEQNVEILSFNKQSQQTLKS